MQVRFPSLHMVILPTLPPYHLTTLPTTYGSVKDHLGIMYRKPLHGDAGVGQFSRFGGVLISIHQFEPVPQCP